MRVLVKADTRSRKSLAELTRTLDELGIERILARELDSDHLSNADMVLVLGGDRDVLQSIHQMKDRSIPILGVNATDETSFLTEASLRDLRQSLRRIKQTDYTVEEAPLLSMIVDGKELPQAANELAVFPYKSATLVEYLLSVDNDVLWRDESDGLIISTPIGSTAYSMSAGGPIILPKAGVFTVVSVNSLDVTRRPIVIAQESKIQITEITSRYECDVIIDGIYRSRVSNEVVASKSPESARIVRLPEVSSAVDRMAHKVRLSQDLLKMPPSAKLILKTLEYEGPLSQKDLAARTLLPDRTARLAISILLTRGLIQRKQLLRDTRQKIYAVV